METVSKSSGRQLKDVAYEIFIVLISSLSVLNVVLLILPLNPIVQDVIEIVEVIISLILIGDFIYRLLTTKSKLRYFVYEWGWIDLLSSLPYLWCRPIRILRARHVVRLMRQKGMTKHIVARFFYTRAESALFVIFFLIILVLEFGGMAIVFAEQAAPNAQITTAQDGIWWVFVTISTVGYGDYVPVTNMGRFISMIVMILGVSTFGVLTSFLARAFASVRAQEDEELLEDNNSLLNAEVLAIQDLRNIIQQQEQTNAVLHERLNQLERLLIEQSNNP